MLEHCMIDIETLNNRPDSAITSVGAVMFDPDTGELGASFYMRVDWASAMEYGTVSAATLKWWMMQSEAARMEVCQPGKSLKNVLKALQAFLKGEIIVWGNGPTFDMIILEHAFRELGMKIPWKYSHVRDCRTIVDAAQRIGKERPPIDEDAAHNALQDAIHQAKYISSMWQVLTRR